MMSYSVDVYSYDDWEGIYVNGELYYEGHDIPNHIFLEIIKKYKIFKHAKRYELSDEDMEAMAYSLPKNIKDIQRGDN